MARTIGNDEERERRIMLVGEYRMETGESTRNIAKHFSSTQFSISNATVASYLDAYVKLRPEVKHIFDLQTYENIPDSIQKEAVKKRTLTAAKLVNSGFTIEEVSNSLNVPYWVIYRDIKKRLPMLDKKLSDSINNMLEERSITNLDAREKH